MYSIIPGHQQCMITVYCLIRIAKTEVPVLDSLIKKKLLLGLLSAKSRLKVEISSLNFSAKIEFTFTLYHARILDV